MTGFTGTTSADLTCEVGLAADPTPLEDLETSVRAPLPPLPPDEAEDSLESIDRLSENAESLSGLSVRGPVGEESESALESSWESEVNRKYLLQAKVEAD